MSTSSNLKPAGAFRRALSQVGRLLREAAKRSYAVALILIILWLSWQALYYLVSSLMLPARPPAIIVDIPTRLSPSALIRPEAGGSGEPATANPRSPLSHYHKLDRGFQADRFNGCSISQCHAPLPHGKNKGDRAFLNMHATSIHCGVCHTQQDSKPLALAWYDLQTGKVRPQAPALLRAFAWLTDPGVRDKTVFTTADQAEIVRLLRAATDEAYQDAKLASLAQHLAAVRAASDEFTRLVQVTRDAVRGHFRGEYGAKLALVEARSGQLLLGESSDDKAVRQFLARRTVLTGEERTNVLRRIHPQQRHPTLQCAECHRPGGGLLDLPSLGYPPARVQAISSPQVTEAIQHIVGGREFHLPEILGNKNPPEK